MRTVRAVPAVLAALVTTAALLTGCGVGPSGVEAAGPAPGGVAPGTTLYFVGQDGALRPELRETGRLGTVVDALALLLTGPGPASDLTTAIPGPPAPVPMVAAGVTSIEIWLPFTAAEVPATGVDQIVCTALGVHRQSGGDPAATVQIRFTVPEPGSDRPRECPIPG